MPETKSRTSASLPPKSILGSAPTIIYAFDVEGRRNLFQNRSLKAMLGYPPAGDGVTVFDEWRAHMHPDDRIKWRAHFARMQTLVPDEIISWECRLQRADGAWLHFLNRDTLLLPLRKRRIVVGVASDISEQKGAERQKELIAAEMRHRSKNFSAIVGAIARQTRPAPGEDALEAFDRLTTRLQTLLGAGDAVLASLTGEVPVAALIELALAPLLGEAVARVQRVGDPQTLLDEASAGGLALIVHELATNALKYGALSVPEGIVILSWTRDADGTIQIEWRDQGGPPVSLPTRRGFGTRVLRGAIPGSALATAFPPEGFHCTIRFRPAGTGP